MNWEDVKRTFLDKWLLIEATNAKTKGDKQIIDYSDVNSSF